MRDVGGYSDAEIDAMERDAGLAGPRRGGAHGARASCAPSAPSRSNRSSWASSTAPTLLLVGSESPEWARRSTQAFAAAIPGAEVRTLQGHGHGASLSGPDLLASELRGFLA